VLTIKPSMVFFAWFQILSLLNLFLLLLCLKLGTSLKPWCNYSKNHQTLAMTCCLYLKPLETNFVGFQKLLQWDSNLNMNLGRVNQAFALSLSLPQKMVISNFLWSLHYCLSNGTACVIFRTLNIIWGFNSVDLLIYTHLCKSDVLYTENW
jgi:hypothetical protein